MAIPQDKYIHIVSSNVGDMESAERDLSGMVFTNTALLTPGADGKAEWESFDTEDNPNLVVLSFTSPDAVRKTFGSGSREAVFADDYFGYISPSGSTARKLSFCRIPSSFSTGWQPADIMTKLDEADTNFGSFCFLQSDALQVGQVEEIIKLNKAKNYKYLFSLSVRKYVNDSEDVANINSTTTLENVTAKSLAEYFTGGDSPRLNFDAGTGTFLFVSVRDDIDSKIGSVQENEETGDLNGDGDTSDSITIYQNLSDPSMDAFAPMTLFASTDYNAVNSTKNFMFKTFDGVLPAVTTGADKDKYDALNINYVGLVQNYGRKRMFLQQGVNFDGEDTACYCNEIWLKSHISTQLFDLLLTWEKIEANETGELLIYNTICSCAELAKTNGTIEILKKLTDTQKRTIFRLTQSDTAWETIYQNGYWLDVEIKQVTVDQRTEYWAYYTLVYAKGDSVRKIEGKDFLV